MIGRIFAFAAVAFAALASHGARMASEPWVEHVVAGATNGPMDAAYRLMSTDGETYQDATGVVWSASVETTLSPWHVASITYSNGVTVATNALPGVPSWSIDGEWREQSETNDWWAWILSIPEGGSEYGLVASQESAETDTALDFGTQDGSATWSFARTNIVTRSWTPADRVLYESSGGGTSGLSTNDVCNIVTNEVAVGVGDWRISPYYGGYWKVLDQWMPSVGTWQIWFTNVSTSAVTDGIVVTGDENASALNVEVEGDAVPIVRDAEIRNAIGLARLVDLPPLTNGLPAQISSAVNSAMGGYLPMTNGTGSVVWDASDRLIVNLGTLTVGPGEIYASAGTISLEGTSDGFTYNSSPVATADTLSTIAQAATNYTDETTIAAINTNNPAFVAAVTNCPVVIAAADGTTLGEFGEYGTLGALLAALAAAITWLKTNKADASSLPYALVTVAPTPGAPFVLADCFPIKYTDGGSTVEITADDANIGILDNGESGYTIEYNAETIFFCSAEGIYTDSAVDGLTFGANEDTPDSSTQVLGFTQTATLTDRAINAVSLSADATMTFPAQTAGKARDFVVRLTLTETDNVVPSVTFPADVAYETEGGEWPDLTEAGTYIVRLTEVPKASESETARFFLQCSSAVADATPPSAGGES